MQSRKISNIVRVTVVSAAAFLMLSGTGVPGGAVVAAQRSPAVNSGKPIDPPPTGSPGLGQAPAGGVTYPGATLSPEEREQLRQMIVERDKRVASDVDKLVVLSNDLKTDVDKTGKDELSLDVIKKAQQIEKLAHDIQSRMKN